MIQICNHKCRNVCQPLRCAHIDRNFVYSIACSWSIRQSALADDWRRKSNRRKIQCLSWTLERGQQPQRWKLIQRKIHYPHITTKWKTLNLIANLFDKFTVRAEASPQVFPLCRYRLYYITHIAYGGFVWNPYWLSTKQLFCAWKEFLYRSIRRIYSHASSKVRYCWICSW